MDNGHSKAMKDNRHENYEILNLIGYGLAKFSMDFVREFGFKTKVMFFEYMVKLGVSKTEGTVKNRQDLFDPFFSNGRKGWWQKGNTYIHRKILIESLYGELGVKEFVGVVRLCLGEKYQLPEIENMIASPILRSKFRKMQETGYEAELYFMNNFAAVMQFENGFIEDARRLGDGYDFQVKAGERFYLAEIKGLRTCYGSLRFTENEYLKAKEFKEDYGLVVVSGLADIPKMTIVFDPARHLAFKEQSVSSKQLTYHTNSSRW